MPSSSSCFKINPNQLASGSCLMEPRYQYYHLSRIRRQEYLSHINSSLLIYISSLLVSFVYTFFHIVTTPMRHLLLVLPLCVTSVPPAHTCARIISRFFCGSNTRPSPLLDQRLGCSSPNVLRKIYDIPTTAYVQC